MKKYSLVLMAAMVLGTIPTAVQAQGSFKGYMINEYYSVFSHHNEDIEGQHGFWFRRIYLTYNNNLSDTIKMRLRFEMNSPGDFKTSDSLKAVVKDAYLSAKVGGQDLIAGIISPPTFGLTIEDFWGYRVLEKTPLDLFKLRSSRDFGIGMKGTLDEGKTVSYMIMLGNSSSNKAETNKGKIFYSALAFRPMEGLVLEAYGDYEAQPDNKTYYVYQGFAGYEGDWGRVGLQYANKHYDNDDEGLDYSIFSGFAVIKAGQKLDLIVRFDRTFGEGFEENFSGHKMAYIPFADNVTANLIIAAVSYNVAKNIWLIPNIKFAMYQEPEMGDKPDADFYGNLTLWFKF